MILHLNPTTPLSTTRIQLARFEEFADGEPHLTGEEVVEHHRCTFARELVVEEEEEEVEVFEESWEQEEEQEDYTEEMVQEEEGQWGTWGEDEVEGFKCGGAPIRRRRRRRWNC